MRIPEWQQKMLKSSPKTIMKHVTREIEMLSSGLVNSKDEQHKQILMTRTVVGDDKKVRKYNIDIHTGKRKYTKKLKLDGGFVNVNSEYKINERCNVALSTLHFFYLLPLQSLQPKSDESIVSEACHYHPETRLANTHSRSDFASCRAMPSHYHTKILIQTFR